MSINAVLIILIIITLFPAISALLLHSKFLWPVLALAAINITVAVAAFKALIVPANHCRAVTENWSLCADHGGTYALVSLGNLILGIIIWYLAFKRESDVPVSTKSGPISRAQFATQNNDNVGLRKFLAGSGRLVWAGIMLFVVIIAILIFEALMSM